MFTIVVRCVDDAKVEQEADQLLTAVLYSCFIIYALFLFELKNMFTHGLSTILSVKIFVLCKCLQTINILIVNISMGLTFPGVEHLQEKITAKAFQSQLCSIIYLCENHYVLRACNCVQYLERVKAKRP